MQKLKLILLAAVLCVGCSDVKTQTYKIGFSQCADDAWRIKMNEDITQEAQLYNNIDLEIRSAGGVNSVQEMDIDYFISNGVDLLIVAPNEAEPITPCVEKAVKNGIPVIVADRKISSDCYTAYIGADNYQIGRSIGLYVAKLLQNGGNVLELTGLMGSTPAIERHSGFIDGISSNSRIRLLDSKDAKWQKDAGFNAMHEALGQYPEIDLVFAHNDDIAYAAYLAAKSVGEQNDIMFIGVDAIPGRENGVDLVLSGILNATFIYPTGGDRIIQLALKILKGETYQRNTVLSTSIVDRSNATLMEMQTRHIGEQQEKINLLNSRLSSLSSDYSRQRILLWLAIAVGCFIISLAVVLISVLRQRNRLNNELKANNKALEQQRDKVMDISKELEDATQAKLTFFTNVSHEFKTPLTLILDPVNQLLQSKDLTDKQRYLLQTASENCASLRDLVSQILDFRRYDRGAQSLDMCCMDILACVRTWKDAFLQALRVKHIKFTLIVDEEKEWQIAGDRRKIERIFYNLMSNAMKFTPENGSILVQLDHKLRDGVKCISLRVHNSGSYISPDERNNIFKRFYTLDSIGAGTGIGLSLAEAYAKMHDGSIYVESDIKEGTDFTVILPVGDPQSLSTHGDDYQLDSISTYPAVDIEFDVMSHEYTQSILVVDDNESIRTYLNKLLQNNFYVIEAHDGQEGLKKALQYIPNIIISDVMMPGINGFELCRRLKNEVQTCHIPVILLTAYSMDANHADAYEAGADSYISKPFSSDVLIARIQNLLDSRVRIRTGSDDILTLGNEKVEDMDRDFMSRFKTVIDENMIKTELSVDFISSELAMSRVQLYRKVKMLTGVAPTEYLRIRRLKKAHRLLSSSSLTIAEVCYETGFNSPSYFSKCYKDYYNELPSDYLRKLHSDETQN